MAPVPGAECVKCKSKKMPITGGKVQYQHGILPTLYTNLTVYIQKSSVFRHLSQKYPILANRIAISLIGNKDLLKVLIYNDLP